MSVDFVIVWQKSSGRAGVGGVGGRKAYVGDVHPASAPRIPAPRPQFRPVSLLLLSALPPFGSFHLPALNIEI